MKMLASATKEENFLQEHLVVASRKLIKSSARDLKYHDFDKRKI